MNLKSEIKVRSFDTIKSRVEISSGIVEVETINTLSTHPRTFVPINDWNSLSNYEIKCITPTENKFTDVSVIKLPKLIIKQFKKLKLHDCLNIADINHIQKTIEYQSTIEKIIRYLKINYMVKNNHEVHNLFFGKPNLSNNTFNTKENVYIGLHLDSWEKQPFTERQNARNRICINLGKEPRHLQFYNISLKTMAEMINVDVNNNLDINNIYKQFAVINPNYPVLRVRVNPYEAYIAPTEFIIHDGSNVNTKYPDINLVIRGYFQTKPKHNILNLILKIINK